MQTPRCNSVSQPIWRIASQNGNYECAIKIVEAAKAQGKHILDAVNKVGRTPCYAAIEKAHVETAGVLAKAGADLRRASPVYFDERQKAYDPSPSLRVRYPLDRTIRSFTTLSCASCGESNPALKLCGKCGLAYFCNKECQQKCWPSHKKCCSKLAKGAGLLSGKMPDPPSEPFGFEDGFISVI